MRLLVHAGKEKTGSFFLQTAVWATYEASSGEEIHYSEDHFQPSGRFWEMARLRPVHETLEGDLRANAESGAPLSIWWLGQA